MWMKLLRRVLFCILLPLLLLFLCLLALLLVLALTVTVGGVALRLDPDLTARPGTCGRCGREPSDRANRTVVSAGTRRSQWLRSGIGLSGRLFRGRHGSRLGDRLCFNGLCVGFDPLIRLNRVLGRGGARPVVAGLGGERSVRLGVLCFSDFVRRFGHFDVVLTGTLGIVRSVSGYLFCGLVPVIGRQLGLRLGLRDILRLATTPTARWRRRSLFQRSLNGRRRVLVTGTPRMPNFNLAVEEVDALVSFLEFVDTTGTYPPQNYEITWYGTVEQEDDPQ